MTDEFALQAHTPEELFSETLMGILQLLPTLSRHDREELLHHTAASLAAVNRMHARAYFATDDDRKGAFAALRANGFEPTIDCVVDDNGSVVVDIAGVSALRDVEFFDWVSTLLEPFGGYVEQAGYAEPVKNGRRLPAGRLTHARMAACDRPWDKENLMGTLFDQPPRAESLKNVMDWIYQSAGRFGFPNKMSPAEWHALCDLWRTALAVQSADVLDEQLTGFGEILSEIASAVTELATSESNANAAAYLGRAKQDSNKSS